jgi:hypothetical protein
LLFTQALGGSKIAALQPDDKERIAAGRKAPARYVEATLLPVRQAA